MQPSLDDYRWLVDAATAPFFEQVAEAARSLSGASRWLRKRVSPARTHLMLEQIELRQRARAKFSRADQMFFTAKGLEQATDERVAAYKATRFLQGGRVVDLACGLGGDMLGLAERGPVIGVERDPVTALLAEANCRALGMREAGWLVGAFDFHDALHHVLRADVCEEPVQESLLADASGWHLDPDRRAGGQRTVQLENMEPSFETIEQLLTVNGDASIKLAPATTVPPGWAQRGELEWISRGGECRQLVVWFGNLARCPGRRRATILPRALSRRGDEAPPRSIIGELSPPPLPAARLGNFIFEPDAAVLASGLAGSLGNEHRLSSVGTGIAYLTGDDPVSDDALGCFEVLEHMPFDLRRLKALLRDRKIGALEVKKRGVKLDPETVRRQLRTSGDHAATLLIFPWHDGVSAVLARRCTDAAAALATAEAVAH